MRFSETSTTPLLLLKQMTGLAGLGRQERIVLSDRDGARVLALLGNPPKPSPALLAAARRHAFWQPKQTPRPTASSSLTTLDAAKRH